MVKVLGNLFSPGKLEKELTELQRQAAQEPNNFYLLIKMGDSLEKMGRLPENLRAYCQASEKYTQNGFLIQAIAVNKLILRLDPAQKQIHDRLAQLYAQRELLSAELKEKDKELLNNYKIPQRHWPLIPLFADLKREELTRIMEKVEVKHFLQGSNICREGEVGDSIFIISNGEVEVFQKNSQGNKIHMAFLREGDFFGEFGFFAKALFRSLSEEERKQLLSKFILEEYPAGAILVKEGGPGDSFFMIKKGEVEVYTKDQQGSQLSLAKLKAGDFFGEISLITGRPRNASVKAIQPTGLLRLPKEDFKEIIERHHQIKEYIKDTLLLRLGDKLRAQNVFQERPGKEGLL